MRRRKSATFALAVLQHFVPDSEALAGDLMEEYGRGRSGGWLWCQVLAAVFAARRGRDDEIRPLKLVESQPADAIERTRRPAAALRAGEPHSEPGARCRWAGSDRSGIDRAVRARRHPRAMSTPSSTT
ncbi:MAG TPA: hypothetical protein VL262_16360 [Vicinamibacterales bacterium]|jgi:hypothetical protein|nr:hypothetical protein [Vicinamibacterales bacterium]